METPTISKKQGKKALSGKKSKKETIKNVVAQPFSNFWPTISKEDNALLRGFLEKALPLVKKPAPRVPYNEIKEIPKADRKAFRENYNKSPVEIDESAASNIIFGVNDVSRLIQDKEADSVLVAHDVKPRLLVQHVLDQAVLFNVPVLVVEDLREIVGSKCGIRSAVVGFKILQKLDSKISLIYDCIYKIAKNYPVPENHVNRNRQLNSNLNADSVIEISDSDSSCNRNLVSNHESEELCHLYRPPGSTTRVFIPPESRGKLDKVWKGLETSNPHIVPLSTSNDIDNVTYKALAVKRLRGDENRNKRKLLKA